MGDTSLFAAVWEYRVRKGREREFEALYGPEGDWVLLFRRSAGYIRTEFFHDLSHGGHYLTIDYWDSEDSHRRFRSAFEREFRELDARGELLTEKETPLGRFRTPGSR
ncbi:MAG: antibiotic biosynthesis monooxygenase [Bacteroidota bacterium]